MALCPRITAYPPLGKVTVLPSSQTKIRFTAVIEWERDSHYPFELELLYADAAEGSHPSSWKSVSLPPSLSPPGVVRPSIDECFQASFSKSICLEDLAASSQDRSSSHIVFTIQRRQNAFDTWKILRGPSGVETGEVIVSGGTEIMASITDVINLAPGWITEKLPMIDDVQIWQINAEDAVEKSQEIDTVLMQKELGVVVDQVKSMAITRMEPFWFGCEHTGDYFYLSNDAVMICFLSKSGQCLTLFAFNGSDDFYTVFKSGASGSVQVCGRNDGTSNVPFRILAAISGDKDKSIAAVMSSARQLASTSPKMQTLIAAAQQQNSNASGTDFFDNLGFCTWNALGQNLTREKLLAALEKLHANGVKFGTLIIDDNWQSLGNTSLDFNTPGFRGWSRFEADEKNFPGGLTALVADIKSKYPYIRYVGVWHALFGYWGGLAHDSDFLKQYATRMIRAKVRYMRSTDFLVVDPSDIHRFYDDFYAFLRSCCVDFVKTDVQYMLSLLVNPKDRAEIPSAYQSAWTSAYLKHFDGRAISCMSQIPQISFHSFLQDKTPKILLRNSDDFFPEIPGSHPFHIFINAHNALLVQHLNGIPDWDMFQTGHVYSSYHAAARAISGGPVLITDEPGHHDLELINAMTALNPANERVAVRPGIASAMDIWDPYTAEQILKVGAPTATGAGIMGLFNIGAGLKEVLIPVADIVLRGNSKQSEKKKWATRSYTTGQLFVSDLDGAATLLKVKLAAREWDVLSSFPVHNVGSVEIAPLGLIDKISGAAAITKCTVTDIGIDVYLNTLGKMGLLVLGSSKPTRITINGTHNVDLAAVEINNLGEIGTLWTFNLEKWWRDNSLWNTVDTISVSIVL